MCGQTVEFLELNLAVHVITTTVISLDDIRKCAQSEGPRRLCYVNLITTPVTTASQSALFCDPHIATIFVFLCREFRFILRNKISMRNSWVLDYPPYFSFYSSFAFTLSSWYINMLVCLTFWYFIILTSHYRLKNLWFDKRACTLLVCNSFLKVYICLESVLTRPLAISSCVYQPQTSIITS